MAIPPVVSNFPALNVFKSDQARNDAKAPSNVSPSAGQTEDLVEISSAALEKLQGDQQLASESEAHELSGNTKEILQDGSYSLGLDPDFS